MVGSLQGASGYPRGQEDAESFSEGSGRSVLNGSDADDVLPTGKPSGGIGILSRLKQDAAHELEDRRGFLLLPVAFGIGAASYFSMSHEPPVYAGLVVTLILSGSALLLRARPVAFHLLAFMAVAAAGFAIASLQVQRMAHPVLGERLYAVDVSGFVEASERRPRGSRITLRVTGMSGDATELMQRVRVTLSGRDPPPVGSHVSVRASLGPPPGPAYPGGFDFGRAIWFDGIGATGYALGKPQETPSTGPQPLSLMVAVWLDHTRRAIAARIHSILPGEDGGVAVALVTGLRDAVAEPIEESMRVSGLTHVLSISGLHMALVATTVFFLVRALLALSPALSLNCSIKAWAAAPASLAASYYLLLSGADVPTQRAYVMTMIVLAGVMLGRPALTLRTIAIAALAILVITPWAVLDPGAQMSFAATLALVAAYERYGQHLFIASRGRGKLSWMGIPMRYSAALVLTSLAAGLATAPYAAFHFQRLSPFSLLANLAAMPVVSFVIMPAGLIGSLLMPFGLDGLAWRIMGWGIKVMCDISDAVASIPGADRGIRAMPVASMILLSLGLVLFCLSRTRFVFLAPVCVGLAVWIFIRAPQPDVLIDGQARTVAVRGADGRLWVMGDRPNGLERRFAVEQWLSADGDRGRIGSKEITDAAACDSLGCTLRTHDGALIAYSKDRDSLEDDCRLATVLITRFQPPVSCAALVIRIDADRQNGGLAAYQAMDGTWTITGRTVDDVDRPWKARRATRSGAETALQHGEMKASRTRGPDARSQGLSPESAGLNSLRQ